MKGHQPGESCFSRLCFVIIILIKNMGKLNHVDNQMLSNEATSAGFSAHS